MDRFYGIYGVGAVIIIVFSQYFNKNNFTLFLGGYLIGSVTEYIISFLTEVVLHTSWWDYANNILNINGRICLLYSIFWGILTMLLIRKFNPFLEKILYKIAEKISYKTTKGLIAVVTLFLLVNCIATCYAQDIFATRLVIQNNIETRDIERRENDYKKIEGNQYLSKFIDTFWNDKKMIRTFPNMKIEDKNGNIIYLDSLLKHIQPYYLKVFDK